MEYKAFFKIEDKWKCTVADGVELHRPTAPCWIHRKMQHLCFGFKWTKL